jgi:hypothetical protein
VGYKIKRQEELHRRLETPKCHIDEYAFTLIDKIHRA